MFSGVSRAVSIAALVVWFGFAVPSVAGAEVFSGGPSDDVEALINALEPGDELILSGGNYTLSERFSFAIAGTENAPITIRAADGEIPHLHRPNANQNIIDIDQAVYVTIRGIEFSGGSAGIRISGTRGLTECPMVRSRCSQGTSTHTTRSTVRFSLSQVLLAAAAHRYSADSATFSSPRCARRPRPEPSRGCFAGRGRSS